MMSDASDVRPDASGMRSDVSELSVRCEHSFTGLSVLSPV